MIDTDKYEGHTEGPWEKIEWETPNPQWDVMLSCPEVGKFASIQGCEGWKPNEADVELMADAPLLLAEVKRLRKRNDWLCWAIADITKGMDEDWRNWQRTLKEWIE
tara:strand:+ start:395 stop:712 length:318 start_codon:yes stop_codon:yes gene_type:complete